MKKMKSLREKKLLRVKRPLRVKKLKEKRLRLKKKMIEIHLRKNLKRYMEFKLTAIENVEWVPVIEELVIQWNSVKICIHSFSYPRSNLSTKSSVKNIKSKTLVNVWSMLSMH